MTVLFDAGDYRCTVVGQGLDQTRTGTPYAYLRIKLLSRYLPGSVRQTGCPQAERECRYWLSSDAGADMLRRDLAAIGVELADVADLHPASPTPVTLVDRFVDVTCEVEEYAGRPMERWRIRRQRPGLDFARQVSERLMQGRTAAAGGTPVPPPPTAPPAADAPVV